MNKTYVCSDIHSHLDVLNKALSEMDDTDVLYVIGDAIDKGPDGIQVLLKIMNDSRCKMLIGNHELMMLQYLTALRREDFDKYDFEDIEYIWIRRNGGRATYRDFKKCSDEEKEQIFEFLKNMYVSKNVTIGDMKYYLIHAGIPVWNTLKGKTDTDCNIKVSDLKIKDSPGYDWKNEYVWMRDVTAIEGKTVVTGHTPVMYYGENEVIYDKENDWYDIDCSFATRRKGSMLAVLCLDDKSIKYYEPEKY